jgi:hypothetical protein
VTDSSSIAQRQNVTVMLPVEISATKLEELYHTMVKIDPKNSIHDSQIGESKIHLDKTEEFTKVETRFDAKLDDTKFEIPLVQAAQIAKKILFISNKRVSLFSKNYFDDPSWHIMLDLLVQSAEGRKVSVSSACIAAMSPPTTALRHLTALVNSKEVIRIQDPYDKRRVYVKLSDEAEAKLINLLTRDR